MNTIKAITALALLAGTATPALATDWRHMGTAVDGTVMLIDVDSARSLGNGRYVVWRQTNSPRMEADGTIYTKARDIIDCNAMTSATTYIASYGYGGRYISGFSYPVKWDYFIPGSAFADFHSKLCDAVYGGRY